VISPVTRRINKQQTKRIQQKQDNLIHSSQNIGLVLCRFKSHAEIETSDQQVLHCSIRPNIDSLVTGDKVIWQPEGDGQGVIISRLPRTCLLSRSERGGKSKALAANITQLVITLAPKPLLSWELLDSYLILAEHWHIEPLIVLNKVDLNCEEIKKELLKWYQPLGYKILFISMQDKKSIKKLSLNLDHQISVFVGQSGVGKSTIINTILPHENIETAEISAQAELGCHTTSNSRLYHLPLGGSLIDSPGIREFGLSHLSSVEIISGFKEFAPLISKCKFRNCNHVDSPDCALLNGLNKGEVSKRRYENFLSILRRC
jgi:ribosome biogenesis GTPase